MKTIEDLPFLKAQAAELERLIRIAPPSAVIAKFQYEEQLSDVREAITGVVKAARQVSVSMSSPPEIEKLISPNEIPSVCGAEIQYAIEEVIPVLREKLSKASDKFKEEIR